MDTTYTYLCVCVCIHFQYCCDFFFNSEVSLAIIVRHRITKSETKIKTVKIFSRNHLPFCQSKLCQRAACVDRLKVETVPTLLIVARKVCGFEFFLKKEIQS